MAAYRRAPSLAGGLLAGWAALALASERWQGLPLTEALARLQRQGLAIVYTSELVRAEMNVVAEPAAHEPRRILDEILAPHGLEARAGPAAVLVVVARGLVATASIEGQVLDPQQRGLAGAIVRVVGGARAAAVASDGRFELTDLPPGALTIEATAPGYLSERSGAIVLAAGATERVQFRLQPQPYLRDEIVVRPSRTALLEDQPDSALAFGRETIARLPHLGGDFFRAASLLPGVAANDVSAQFSIHGGRRDEVKIVLDGQELYDAFHLKDYDNALSVVAARTLAGAGLSTGAFPASHGDRMGGVLELETADPAAGTHLTLAASVFDALALSAGRFAGDRGAWLLSARGGSLRFAGDVIGTENPRFWDLLGKLEYSTSFGRWSAHLLVADDALEIDQTQADSFERLENEYRNTAFWLTHRLDAGGRLLVETVAAWSTLNRDRDGSTREEKGSFVLGDHRDHEIGSLTQSWSLQLAPHQLLRWGWELRDYQAEFDYARTQEPALVILAPFSPPPSTEFAFAGTIESDHAGLWIGHRIGSIGPLTAELGLRYDRHSATGDAHLSPRANLAWSLGQRGVVRAGWGRFVQSQRPYELQVEDGETALRTAERSAHWLVGYEMQLAVNPLGLEALRVEWFRRALGNPRPRYENLLEAVNFFPEVEPDRVRIAAERSRAQGLELLLRARAGTRAEWWLSYAYARSEDRIAGDWVPRALDQPNTLAFDLNLRLPGKWDLNLAWRYHSGWPTTPVEPLPVTDPDDPESESVALATFGPLRSERLPVYHRLDLRASRAWELPAGRLTFFADIQNAYDRRNQAGFDVSFDDQGALELADESWPGIFPSAGLAWEF
jgi:outer membrane receptor protein involved in Fe transport